MICLDCADAADAQKSSKALSYTEKANYEDEMLHPKDCGCTCQHGDVGTVLFSE